MRAFARVAYDNLRAIVARDGESDRIDRAVFRSACAMARIADIAGANFIVCRTCAFVSWRTAGSAVSVTERQTCPVLPKFNLATLIWNEVWTGQCGLRNVT